MGKLRDRVVLAVYLDLGLLLSLGWRNDGN
jgi:hypothetical protein